MMALRQLDYQVVDNPKQHCVILGNRGASGGRLVTWLRVNMGILEMWGTGGKCERNK